MKMRCFYKQKFTLSYIYYLHQAKIILIWTAFAWVKKNCFQFRGAQCRHVHQIVNSFWQLLHVVICILAGYMLSASFKCFFLHVT